MNNTFNNQILTEKLRKLDNSQHSIETLSHWCIFHRKKAHLVVETWDKQLRELPKEQSVPFLYLANDIIQNSKRRGEEFVSEFWNILPGALKNVIEKGDSKAQSVVSRLVDIWDERKVFGARTRTLKQELLGSESPVDLLEKHAKPNNTIKIKVPTVNIQEKLTSAYGSVNNIASEEDEALGRCNAAIVHIDSLVKDAADINSGEEHDRVIATQELQAQQGILAHCIEQWDMSKLARVALVSLLKEALQEQESKLVMIQYQCEMARAQLERSQDLCKCLQVSTNVYGSAITDIATRAPESGHIQGSAEGLAMVSQFSDQSAAGCKTDYVGNLTPTNAAEVVAKSSAPLLSTQLSASTLLSIGGAGSSAENTPYVAPLETPLPADKRQRLFEQPDNHNSNPQFNSDYTHQLATQFLPFQGTSLQPYPHISMQQQGETKYHLSFQYPIWPPYSGATTLTSGQMRCSQYPLSSVPPPLPPAPPSPPPPPPPPLPLPLPLPYYSHQNLPSHHQITTNPHNVKPGAFSSLQPPIVGMYGHMSLPINHLQRP